MSARIDWGHVLERARVIATSYTTRVTLRQLFYRLVSEQTLPNTQSAYKTLSARTAEARRNGGFPDLMDRGRSIHRYAFWADAKAALQEATDTFQLDHTLGQDVSLYLGVEKAGMIGQLQDWFEDHGVPILALGGYSSQSYVDQVVADISRRGRPAVLLYAGDFDPSGEDIDRDFLHRTNSWQKVVRVALTAEQVIEHSLPINPGKAADPRSTGFIARHGELMQVELDALPPDTLKAMFETAVDEFWDVSAFEDVMRREADELGRLDRLASRL